MFEKEAEEWLDERYLKDMGIRKPCKKAFLAGAEFGYNKANEWHYVKDGEYPKECDCCLLYLGSSFNCITGWRHRGVWYFEDNRDLEMWQDKVIAWKEIVLPKESK